MNKFWLSMGVASALLLASCGGGDAKKDEEKKAEAPAAAPVDDANAATVTGSVKFTGAKPPMRNLSMDATPACARAHPTAPKSEEVVVNDNGTLRYTFVWVKAGLADRQFVVKRERQAGGVDIDGAPL